MLSEYHLPYTTLYIIRDDSPLNKEENKHTTNINTHVDFLLYNHVSKQPILVIKIDDCTYDKSETNQSERDIKRIHISKLYEIPLLRLSTIREVL